MNVTLLADKYARAFLAVTNDAWSAEQADAYHAAANALRGNRLVKTYLAIGLLPSHRVIEILQQFLDGYHIPEQTRRLLEVLAEHHRMSLLGDVLAAIATHIYARCNVEHCVIASACTIGSDALQLLEQALSRARGTYVKASGVVDKSLMAGIRVTADEFMWEDSLRQRLNQLSQLCRGQ